MKKIEIFDGKKECSKCKKWYPATLKFFHSNKSHSTGLLSQCKECRKNIEMIIEKEH